MSEDPDRKEVTEGEQEDAEHTQATDREGDDEQTNGGTDQVETVTGRPVGQPEEGLVQKLQQPEPRSRLTETLKIYAGIAGIYLAYMVVTGIFNFGTALAAPAGSVLIGAGPLLALHFGESFTELDEGDRFAALASFIANGVGYLSVLVILGFGSLIAFGGGSFVGPIIARLFLPAMFATLVVGAAGAGRTYYELNY